MTRHVALALVASTLAGPAAAQPSADERAAREQFLASAAVVATRPVSTGITGTLRVTLDDGSRRHDASVQRIDQTKTSVRTPTGRPEFGFRDTWKFNLAAYHVARLLGIDNVPATVERAHGGRPSSYTWWVDDVIMDEGGRQKRQAEAPDRRRWEHQMATMRVFDALIANTDRNKGNLLIDKDWTVWLIDHSRAFRRSHRILAPEALVRCDRGLLAALKALDEATLRERTSRWLTGDEIRAVMARRDAIVARLESIPSALYTYTP